MQHHNTQNSDTLRFFFHPMSRARSVRWMLEECQATYEAVLLDYGTSMKGPAYLALNPMGKVPALQHGKALITETAAVLAYLADLFPERQLAPAVGSAERGSYYRWLFFVAGPVEAITTAQAEGWLAGPANAAASPDRRLWPHERCHRHPAAGCTRQNLCLRRTLQRG